MRNRNRSTATTPTLTTEQLNELIQLVSEESGNTLTRAQFNEAMLMLFENIAGFDLLTGKRSTSLLNTLWSIYQHADGLSE